MATHDTKSKTAAQKADEAAAERMTRNPTAPQNESQTTQPGDVTSSVDMRVANAREPIPNARPGAEPMTPAAGALAPDSVGTAGVIVAEEGEDGEPAEVTAARDRATAHAEVSMRKVILLRDYFPSNGGARIKAVKAEDATLEDAIEMPVEEARYIEEAGIGQGADTFPFRR